MCIQCISCHLLDSLKHILNALFSTPARGGPVYGWKLWAQSKKDYQILTKCTRIIIILKNQRAYSIVVTRAHGMG